MEEVRLPRLSTRLLLALHKEEVTSYNKLSFIYQNNLQSINLLENNKKTFELHTFIGDKNDITYQRKDEIKKIYQQFLEQASGVINQSGNATQKNGIKTLYNIITKNASKTYDQCYQDTLSYFGFISGKTFNELYRLGKELDLIRKSQHNVDKAPKEYGMDIVFQAFQSELIKPDIKIDYEKFRNDQKSSIAKEKIQLDQVEHNNDWLHNLCKSFLESNHSIVFDADQFADEITKICVKHDKSDEELQMKLFELIGENGFEIMLEIIRNKDKLIGSSSSNKPPAVATSNPTNGQVTKDYNSLSYNQRKKLELKEKKELELAFMESSKTVTPGIQSDTNSASNADWLKEIGFNEDFLSQERALGLQKGKNYNNEKDEDWFDNLAPPGSSEYYEKKSTLPAGSERKVGPGYEEIHIPAAKPVKLSKEQEEELLIPISQLEPWAQEAFSGTKRLNRIQSIVFPCAYQSNENMLVCAPTGAGKTNIAMLAFLQLVKLNLTSAGGIDHGAVKAVYIAPMKALAQEVVAKFSERLEVIGMVVKEYTGDMQLTKQEVQDSQLLVCTPEKFDVITRKGGDGSLSTMVSLIIIDEVHLLAEERGAVIETIVARMQRYVESSQRPVRIVGLSATLPNYKDVAQFLRVNSKTGLFFFGPEYRPIPLDQTFIGITEKQRVKRNEQMNRQAYDKMVHALERGKQVMIFVHARKETSKTAEAMADLSGKNGTTSLLENIEHEQFTLWKRQVDKSRSTELQQLFYKGILERCTHSATELSTIVSSIGLGVHHAGMLRVDRSMTEKLFECGIIKVLCCTATLAWGVNLPAHTVIIKGTELYDPERGGFVDLSILDVFQIFGRAGRPQYDNSGHAILITPHKSLSMYLGLLAQQAPIESALIKSLADHMNAEIVNGTINNIKEAVSWLSYTFLFVRMCKNPVAYGISYDEIYTDPRLENKRIALVRQAAEILDECMMVRYDRFRSDNLGVTDLGRIASHYYIKYGTIQAFNSMLTPHLGDAEALHVLCSSAEFDQLKMRPEELVEMDSLRRDTYIKVQGGTDDTAGKVNILLQGYLSHQKVNSFTLQSDTNYVAQNAGRITRALFEICLKRGWSTLTGHYLSLCKCIDKRMRIDQTPLRQFDDIPPEVFKRLEDTNSTIDRLLEMDAKEIGQLVHNHKISYRLLQLSKALPNLHIDYTVHPITRGILRLCLDIKVNFEWIDRYHQYSQSFWIWVEDGNNEYIYHSEHVTIAKKQRNEVKKLEFIIPIREPLPPQYYIRAVSDSWVGGDSVFTVSFQHLILPTMERTHTDLLDMHPIPRQALNNAMFEQLYSFHYFNPIQTQTFHSLYHTDTNILVGAPTGSGKTITAELAIMRLLRERPGAKTIYVAPLKALARERLNDWQKKFGKRLSLSVLELTGDITPDVEKLNRADILIVTPEKWDSISRGWQRREYVKRVELMIIDEIHLLGVDRGPVLEVIVSRMRYISTQTTRPIRFVGLSTALANPRDLADWLGIGDVGVYNFRPSVRPIPMTIHIQGFPGKHYCPRMATMNKPAYAAILEHAPSKPALIFVSSRRQTRLTALDLISYCASDDNPKKFLHMPEDDIEAIASTIRDGALKDTILFGVAIHHAGLDSHDRSIVEELFFSAKIQVLVCTSTLAWGVNLPCHLVIVKGTEFFDAKSGTYVDFPVTDVLQMMGRAGRPQFDDTGVACIFVHEPKKIFYRKFLHEPFPVESSLHKQLHEHINAEIANNALHNLQDCMEFITWTYFFRRLVMNPSYYELSDCSVASVEQYLIQLISSVVNDLATAECIEIAASGKDYEPSYLGKIASYYYLNYKTVGLFKGLLFKLQGKISNQLRQPDIDIPSLEEAIIQELILILSSAYEFSELPVRHNENLLNLELSGSVPWGASQSSLFSKGEAVVEEDLDPASPHTKTYLLIQAHMYRIPLPISDYLNDTKSVMDQIPRVLNALIDIAAEEGHKILVRYIAKVSQLVTQRLGVESNSLYQVKGMTPEEVTNLTEKFHIKNLRNLVDEVFPRNKLSKSNSQRLKYENLLQESFPLFEINSVKISESVSESTAQENKDGSDVIYNWNVNVEATRTALKLVAEKDYTIMINLNCKANIQNLKHKDVSWWIVLCLEKFSPMNANMGKSLEEKTLVCSGEVLAMKRIGRLTEKSDPYSLSFTILDELKEQNGSSCLSINLLCDSFLGLDMIEVIPINIE